MLSRFLFLFGGLAMLAVATGGVVTWAAGFTFLEEALVYGVPFFFGAGASEIKVPGRLFGIFVIIIPVLGAVGGIWFLRLASDREQ